MVTRPSDLPTGRCGSCGRRVAVTHTGALRVHMAPGQRACPGSGMTPKGGVRP